MSKLFDLAAVAVAYPLAVAGSAWLGGRFAALAAVAIGVVLAARFGLRARGGVTARAEPPADAGPAAAAAPAGLPPGPEVSLALLRARVDEVAYAPGSPNVLSMTKYLCREPGSDLVPALAQSWRQDDGEDTVLGIRGALDATTLPALGPILEALVAARRRTVTLDLHELRAVDAAGAAAVAALHRGCREHGGAVLVSGLANQPLAVFRLLGLDARLRA